MGKLFVPQQFHTPAARIREALDQAEHIVSNLRGIGDDQALELLHLLDQVVEGIAELEEGGADLRAERTRLETIQQQLRHQKGRFLSEVGSQLQKEREAVQPNRSRWWWFLDEAAVEQRKRRLRQVLIGAAAVVAFLLTAWLAYDQFIAPPPSVRRALRHKENGIAQIERGKLPAALDEFETAIELNPDAPELWIWKGVLHAQLNEPSEAKAAFDKAELLYENKKSFLLNRGKAYLRVGDLEASHSDAEQVITEYPESAWGYYLRAGIALTQEDYETALADLEKTAELARAAGDLQLEVQARSKRAVLLKSEAGQEASSLPDSQ